MNKKTSSKLIQRRRAKVEYDLDSGDGSPREIKLTYKGEKGPGFDIRITPRVGGLDAEVNVVTDYGQGNPGTHKPYAPWADDAGSPLATAQALATKIRECMDQEYNQRAENAQRAGNRLLAQALKQEASNIYQEVLGDIVKQLVKTPEGKWDGWDKPKAAGMQDGPKEGRTLGKCLTEDPRIIAKKIEYIRLYRAVAQGATTFNDYDYCTLTLQFAKDHAAHGAAVDEEPYVVLSGVFPTSWIFEASNPGEYFFHQKSGKPSKGRVIYTVGPDGPEDDDEEGEPKQAARMPDAEIVGLFDLTQPKIWKDRNGTDGMKCYRCGKPIRTIVEVPVKGGGLNCLGLDCFLQLKGRQRGKPVTPAVIRAEIQGYLEQGFKETMGAISYTVGLTTKGEVFTISVNGEAIPLTSAVRYGVETAVDIARTSLRDTQWQQVLQEWQALTGAKTMQSMVRVRTAVAPPTQITVDGATVKPKLF